MRPATAALQWAQPLLAAGPVLVNFEEGRNKGLTIGGKAVAGCGDGNNASAL